MIKVSGCDICPMQWRQALLGLFSMQSLFPGYSTDCVLLAYDYPYDYSYSLNSSASWNHELSKTHSRCITVSAAENKKREFMAQHGLHFAAVFFASCFSQLKFSNASPTPSCIDFFLLAPLHDLCCKPPSHISCDLGFYHLPVSADVAFLFSIHCFPGCF